MSKQETKRQGTLNGFLGISDPLVSISAACDTSRPTSNAFDTSYFCPQALTSRKLIGAHIFAPRGPQYAVLGAHQIGARAFAMDVKDKRVWKDKPLRSQDIAEFREWMQLFRYEPHQVLPHGTYLINLGSPDAKVRANSLECLVEELERCAALGLTQWNFHPGSSCGRISREVCMDHIAANLNEAHRRTKHLGVVTVLENMAGQSNVIGSTWEDLRYIIDRVDDKKRVGICLDTCHAFAAGMDLRHAEGVEKMMTNLQCIVGLQYLRGLHLNDSRGSLASRLDRHAPIGQGCIGADGFRALMRRPELDGIPMILETPCPKGGARQQHAAEIARLYAMENESTDTNTADG